jgi:hypothetical protein
MAFIKKQYILAYSIYTAKGTSRSFGSDRTLIENQIWDDQDDVVLEKDAKKREEMQKKFNYKNII